MKAQLFEQEKIKLPLKTLRERYLVPPFSILDTSVGEWLSARNNWESLIKNRANNIRNDVVKTNTPYLNKFDYDEGYKGLERNGSTSTFDPFLCEILVRWFSRENDKIYDPFAGGHVRGMISAILGRNYMGIDISELQVSANYQNWELFKEKYEDKDLGNPCWVIGDSTKCYVSECDFDMLLTCPPYYNLEVYTNDDRDLSNCKSYDEFIQKFKQSLEIGYESLKYDSFAVIVVAEIRDKDGLMYGFVPDTIQICREVGFMYYNELILANRIMSLGVRCPKYFDQSRKIGRHHQNVLVFYKGNPKNIEEKFGKFER